MASLREARLKGPTLAAVALCALAAPAAAAGPRSSPVAPPKPPVGAAPASSSALSEPAFDTPRSMHDAIMNHVAACWRMPEAAPPLEPVEVRVHVKLARDGSVIGNPAVEDAVSRGQTEDPSALAARVSAWEAVVECAPYDFLPKDR